MLPAQAAPAPASTAASQEPGFQSRIRTSLVAFLDELWPERRRDGRERVATSDLAVELQGRLLGEPPEHTHEGDLVREAQPIVGAPSQGDLLSVGLEKGGIANQAGGERQSGSETGTILLGTKGRSDRTVQQHGPGRVPCPASVRYNTLRTVIDIKLSTSSG